MRTVTLPAKICQCQHLHDARCRRLPRCKRCGRVLAFSWSTGLCFGCEQQAKAEAAAKADPATRRCRLCGVILQGVFADAVCTRCAAVANVKGGGK